MGQTSSVRSRLEPKLVTVLREGYSRQQFAHDLGAGVIVGIVALPLAIAFAIASGVGPERGLYTAVVAGFLISALGGSRVQIGGPTGAFIVLVYGIVQKHGYDGLALATLMAGVMLLVLGVARLGTVIQFVPYPVTVGFTSGIALIIAVSQVRDALGLQIESLPADFVGKMSAYAEGLGTWNPYALGVALFCIVVIRLWPRLTTRVPGSLVAIVVSAAVVALFDLPVPTIGDRFGSVPSTLPAPALPRFDWQDVRELSPAAMSICLLAAIESLLSAVVADGMAGTRHRPNMELVAQGFANIASPLFGGIPATGAIARTAANIKSGGRTPVAGMVHAVTLLLIMVFFGKLAARVPLAALAGILMLVAYNMSEWRVFAHLLRSPRSDVMVLLTTLVLTVLVDLTVALQVGIVLASLLFMRRMASLSDASVMTGMLDEDEHAGEPEDIRSRRTPPGVEVFEIYGTLFFGAASKVRDRLAAIERPPKVLILRLRSVLAIDATGMRALQDIMDKAHRDGTVLMLSDVQPNALAVLDRAGLIDRIGRDRVLPDIDTALSRAEALVRAHAPHGHP